MNDGELRAEASKMPETSVFPGILEENLNKYIF